MNLLRSVVAILLLIFVKNRTVYCWTDEDLELFDLVENTDKKFYDILGVDQKASASDIRKAYRRLSTIHHPDKSEDPDAEEKFRKIAAIADVLRNEEQRKKYDVILQTGLPDWREPIYYYRRVRSMGLLQLVIFLFCLATVAQYLFLWSAYWEKKYEIEELISSKLKKSAKQQRKNKTGKTLNEVDATAIAISDLPKPRCQDLFPVQLVFLLIHWVKSSPCYVKAIFNMCKRQPEEDDIEDDDDETDQYERKVRQRTKKHVKPQFPEFEGANDEGNCILPNVKSAHNGTGNIHCNASNKISTQGSDDLIEFKKAMKKFPNGTLQRWEKIAEYLNCSVSEVLSMAKQLKSQQFARNVPISSQGFTGFEDNLGNMSFIVDGNTEHTNTNGAFSSIMQNGTSQVSTANGTLSQRSNVTNGCSSNSSQMEKVWKQEEQRLLEMALQKFPKETPARWECIAEFVKSKTKEECVIRYKELAQQIKQKKCKGN